ncbi:MAG TPA: hypothetical protein VI009_15610, partial [Xanthobacteraceae bacterium]
VRFVFDWMMRHWNLWREEANDDPLFTKKKFQTWLSAGGLDARIFYSTYLPPHLFYLIDRRKGEWLLATTDTIFNSIPGLRRLGGVIIAEAVKTTVSGVLPPSCSERHSSEDANQLMASVRIYGRPYS